MRVRNVPLLRNLTRAYGSCAIVARSGESVVGTCLFENKPVVTKHVAMIARVYHDGVVRLSGGSHGIADSGFAAPASLQCGAKWKRLLTMTAHFARAATPPHESIHQAIDAKDWQTRTICRETEGRLETEFRIAVGEGIAGGSLQFAAGPEEEHRRVVKEEQVPLHICSNTASL